MVRRAGLNVRIRGGVERAPHRLEEEEEETYISNESSMRLQTRHPCSIHTYLQLSCGPLLITALETGILRRRLPRRARAALTCAALNRGRGHTTTGCVQLFRGIRKPLLYM